MRNHQTRLPIILILIVLLSASSWAVASASSRLGVTLHGSTQLVGGRATTLSGEPDQPGVIGIGTGGKATGGSSHRVITSDLGASNLGIWIRLLQVRIFGL